MIRGRDKLFLLPKKLNQKTRIYNGLVEVKISKMNDFLYERKIILFEIIYEKLILS